jgi:hypothetical protein
MGLVRGMSTTSTRKRKQSPKSTNAAHDKFLMKMGAHPSQRGKTSGVNSIPSYKTRETVPLSNKIEKIVYRIANAPSGAVEVGQIYNKGPLQVISKNDDLNAGKRRA